MKRAIRKSCPVKSASQTDPKYYSFHAYGGHFGVHYNLIDNSVNADPQDMWNEFTAQISEIHPYDDAEYAWASLKSGVVSYIRNGKTIDKTYYVNADDMDVENNEWCDMVVEEAARHLRKLNSGVKPKIIHN